MADDLPQLSGRLAGAMATAKNTQSAGPRFEPVCDHCQNRRLTPVYTAKLKTCVRTMSAIGTGGRALAITVELGRFMRGGSHCRAAYEMAC